MQKMINLGDIAKDSICGFTGVVATYGVFYNNCDRVGLQSQELKDGAPGDTFWFDLPGVELITAGVFKAEPLVVHSFNLGDEVKDTLSPFKGKITGFVTYINGCVRASIQSAELKDGHPVDIISLAVQQLELVKQVPVAEPKTKTGGPMQSMKAQKVSR